MSTTMAGAERLLAVMRMALTPGVGPRTYQALLERFGEPEGIDRATLAELRTVPGVGPKMARAILEARQTVDAAEELRNCRERSVHAYGWEDPAYPRPLLNIHSPPIVLFVRGELLATDALAVAIVGTRHASSYGLRQAERLAGGLARAGMTVVSGLARGIDAAAHRGALQAGGRTIAVLGCGVLNVYPPEHKELATQVLARGAMISEAPPRSQPQSGLFPQRNRIISGLSLGVVVVEAAERSGALISAEHAMEQGREVFAVPGPIDSRTSRGCHQLIRDGAKLVESVDDVLDELGPLVSSLPRPDGRVIRHPAELQLNDQEQAVLDATTTEPTSIDAIVHRSALPIHRVLATLSVLEMRRLIRRVSGSQVRRA